MIKILTSAQMREVDRLSTDRYGVPGLFLMENAGAAVVQALREACPDLAGHRIAIICGKGNNGGDGMVVARHLIMGGLSPDVYLLAEKAEIKGDARVNLDILDRMQHPILEIPHAEAWRARSSHFENYEIIIDGLLGTGLSKPVSGLYEEVIKTINRMRPYLVLAIDIPSGLAADAPTSPGEAVRADLTVTFTAPKPVHILSTTPERIGRLIVAPIGSPNALLERPDYNLNLFTLEDVRRVLPPRRPDSHKGSYGHILVIAGSVGKTGAAAMTGLACLKSGAGLVTVATPKSAQAPIAAHAMELMTEGMEETGEGTLSEAALTGLLSRLHQYDALALGPGLTTHPSTVRVVHELVRKSPVPIVLDADGVNAFQGRLDALRNENGQPLVLTPHPGEMARLLQKSIAEVQADRIATARRFAGAQGVILALKGHRTLTAASDGAVYVNPTGNPGMATAGAGDVLTGMIAGLLVNRTPDRPKEYPQAVAAAVYMHGRAGDHAARQTGQESLTASDIIKYLPDAMKEIREEE